MGCRVNTTNFRVGGLHVSRFKGAPLVRASVAAVLGGATWMGLNAAALAAEELDLGADEFIELEEVQVTGSRIQVPGNYVAPNPVTSVTGEDLRRLGMVNVADAITNLVPQNISQYQPAMAGNLTGLQSSFFIGQTIANLRGLDPAFGSRTLTMIDGRRVVSTSNQADVVDLNIIPSNLLQRMDVVTGGASAAYGSGAMAGVVNLVLNNRMQGINLDMDYGVHEAGDGGNKHIAMSGGTSLFSGRGHILFGAEWQEQNAITNCAAARTWCAESRGLLENSDNAFLAPGAAFTPLVGYEGMPSRFRVDNRRYSQFTPNGAIISQNVNNTSGYRFTEDGLGVEQYDFGFRGGANPGSSVVGGDGPPSTWGTTLTPQSERKTAFSHFEFDFNENTTGYLEASFARTDGLNQQYPTQLSACVRFDTPGTAPTTVAARPGRFYPAGTPVSIFADPFFTTAGFNWVDYAPPIVSYNSATYEFTFAADFTSDIPEINIPGTNPLLGPGGEVGGNSYAFLRDLSPDALAALMAAATTRNPGSSNSGNAPATGNGAAQLLYGQNPCIGHAGVYKVWNPQIQQRTEQQSETMRGVMGIKGRLGNEWRWDAYYQFGKTESESRQYNAMTNYRYTFAMDAVIDDRPDSPTYGEPVCRVTRDGAPTHDYNGVALSDPAGMAALAAGCQPLNIFGNGTASPEALAYAFRTLQSTGENQLHVVALNTSGTVWQGWAGPLTAAMGVEYRKDKVSNAGSQGSAYERADFPFPWADAFGGTTQVIEEYLELNMPLISGMEGVNMWSVNGAVRHAQYKNKGGAGTSGASATQNITNWKFSTVFEPFDWARVRLTRSRDLRAAGYRELFYNQRGTPDSTTASNPWREYNPLSNADRQDRLTTNTIGNPGIKPETSDTLTLGFVLSPGGWAQGMRMSVDYYDIKVKDGLQQAYSSPIQACWAASGNQDPVYEDGELIQPAINGRFDASNPFCQRLQFGDPVPELVGTPFEQYSNIIAYDNSFENGEPFRTRGLDLSWDYMFQADRLLPNLPGAVALTVRANRALEASGLLSAGLASALGIPRTTVDYVGQLGSGLGWVPGIQPTPKWSGNIITSYIKGAATVSLSARYVGGAKIDKVFYSDSPGEPYFQDANGRYVWGSIDNNSVAPYLNFALNGSYDLQVQGTRQFQVFGSVNNLFDKDPPYAGGYLSGASPQFHDIYGRSYRMGVRVKF
jgi:outer membrane receptor protein involved in Fe transport